MFKKSWLIIVVLVALLASSVFAVGVDDEGNPNDPTVNERANACYEGGTLGGVCGDNEILWKAGWALIRYEAGLMSAEEINALFDWLGIEQEIVVEVAVGEEGTPYPGCVSVDSVYVNFGNNNFILMSPVSAYTDDQCQVPYVKPYPTTLVFAANKTLATDVCQTIDVTYSVVATFSSFVYICKEGKIIKPLLPK